MRECVQQSVRDRQTPQTHQRNPAKYVAQIAPSPDEFQPVHSTQPRMTDPSSSPPHSDHPPQASAPVATRSRLVRGFLIAVGMTSLGLGIIGIVLPLLPTTPFLLLSAACFMRSSPRLYAQLLNHRWLGPYIRTWREGRGIPMRAKLLGITMIVTRIGSSALWVVPIVAVKWLLVAIGGAVVTYLLRMPTADLETATQNAEPSPTPPGAAP